MQMLYQSVFKVIYKMKIDFKFIFTIKRIKIISDVFDLKNVTVYCDLPYFEIANKICIL